MFDSDSRRARGAGFAQLCLTLLGVFSIACDGGGVAPSDAGPPSDDAGPPVVETDAGPRPVEGCRADADCEDGDECTENVCDAGECWASRIEGCFECTTTADCDDGWECSLEQCVGGRCTAEWNPACECLNDGDCDDGNPATDDRCVANRCEHASRSCTDDPGCDDMNACTTDTCVGGLCQSAAIPGCGSCPDRDGDGHATRFCFPAGDDCDDMNPAVNPSATEVCDDMLDNDCDGHVDQVDSDCSTGATTCMGVPAITPGTPVTGAIVHDPSTTAGTPCGNSNYHALTLSALSDVTVTVTLDSPPPPTPVPGCPECTPSGEFEYWYNVFLESTCGDPSTDVGGAGSGCYTFGNLGGFGGSDTRTLTLRRVPAGSYTVDVQAQDFFGWMAVAIGYTLTVTVTPSAAPACSAATALTEGVTARGDAMTGSDAFGTSCSGAVATADEALHTFTLASRRRVRLEAAGVPDMTSMYYPGLRLGLYGACDPSATRIDCTEHRGSDCHPVTTLERILDPGTYWAVVEGNGGVPIYDLTLTTEAVGAACAGAPAITASAALMGDTTGAPDVFRDDGVCGHGYAGDRVYRMDVAARSRVVLDVIASYSNPLVTLFEGCGEQRVAGGDGRSRLDTVVDPGTYHVVVGGDRPGDEGTYVLNATLLAAP